MPTTTEIMVCPLKPGSDIGDENSEAAKIIKGVGTKLKKTDGVQRVQFGMQVEKPDVFQLLVHWDSIDHHRAFESTADYGPFVERFSTTAAGAPSFLHVDFQPSYKEVSRCLSAPATEVATFYFGPDGPPAGYLDGVHKFIAILESEKSEGYVAAAVGLSYEKDAKSPKDGFVGPAAVLLIGWESVEKHMQFREGATFKENLHYLRNGVKEVEMHHVAFLEFVE